MTSPAELSLCDAAERIRSRELSSREVTAACVERIERHADALNCFIRFDADEALAQADTADWRLPAARRLARSTPCRSRTRTCSTGGGGVHVRLEDPARLRADRTATVLRRLDAAGALDVGGLNLSEFAHGPTGHNAHFGACRNPWNPATSRAARRAARGRRWRPASYSAPSARIPAARSDCRPPPRPRRHQADPDPGEPSRDDGPLVLPSTTRGRSPAPCATRPGSSGSSRATTRRTRRAAPSPCRTTRRRPSTPKSAVSASGCPATTTTKRWRPSEGPPRRLLRELEGLGAEIVEVTVPHHEHIAHLQHIVQTSEAATLHADWLADRADDYGPQVRARIVPVSRRPQLGISARSSFGRASSPTSWSRSSGSATSCTSRRSRCPYRPSRRPTSGRRARSPGHRRHRALHPPHQLPHLPVHRRSRRLHRQRVTMLVPACGSALRRGDPVRAAAAYEAATGFAERAPDL